MNLTDIMLGQRYVCPRRPPEPDEGSGGVRFNEYMQKNIGKPMVCLEAPSKLCAEYGWVRLDDGFHYLPEWLEPYSEPSLSAEHPPKIEVGARYVCPRVPEDIEEDPCFVEGMRKYLGRPLRCQRVCGPGWMEADESGECYFYHPKWLVRLADNDPAPSTVETKEENTMSAIATNPREVRVDQVLPIEALPTFYKVSRLGHPVAEYNGFIYSYLATELAGEMDADDCLCIEDLILRDWGGGRYQVDDGVHPPYAVQIAATPGTPAFDYGERRLPMGRPVQWRTFVAGTFVSAVFSALAYIGAALYGF